MIEIFIMLIIDLLVFFYNFFPVTLWILVGIVVAVAVVIIVGAIWTKIKEERPLSWEECQSYRAEINKIYYRYSLKKKMQGLKNEEDWVIAKIKIKYGIK